MTETHYRTASVAGVEIFYREAGDLKSPTLLLLHGFPTSSHMFRDLIPLLADRFHLVLQDFGGPIGFRLATRRPQQVHALIIQNANAYDEGVSSGNKDIQFVLHANYGSNVGAAHARRRPFRAGNPCGRNSELHSRILAARAGIDHRTMTTR